MCTYMNNIILKGPLGHQGGYVKNSSITNSSIDMNNTRITNVGDPTQPKDAVNKIYLDNIIIAGFQVTNTTLSGTTRSIISNSSTGSFVITISATLSGQPSGIFAITKNNSSHNLSENRISCSSSNSSTRLDIIWPSGSGIYLYKNGVDNDGVYNVKIF